MESERSVSGAVITEDTPAERPPIDLFKSIFESESESESDSESSSSNDVKVQGNAAGSLPEPRGSQLFSPPEWVVSSGGTRATEGTPPDGARGKKETSPTDIGKGGRNKGYGSDSSEEGSGDGARRKPGPFHSEYDSSSSSPVVNRGKSIRDREQRKKNSRSRHTVADDSSRAEKIHDLSHDLSDGDRKRGSRHRERSREKQRQKQKHGKGKSVKKHKKHRKRKHER